MYQTMSSERQLQELVTSLQKALKYLFCMIVVLFGLVVVMGLLWAFE